MLTVHWSMWEDYLSDLTDDQIELYDIASLFSFHGLVEEALELLATDVLAEICDHSLLVLLRAGLLETLAMDQERTLLLHEHSMSEPPDHHPRFRGLFSIMHASARFVSHGDIDYAVQILQDQDEYFQGFVGAHWGVLEAECLKALEFLIRKIKSESGFLSTSSIPDQNWRRLEQAVSSLFEQGKSHYAKELSTILKQTADIVPASDLATSSPRLAPSTFWLGRMAQVKARGAVQQLRHGSATKHIAVKQLRQAENEMWDCSFQTGFGEISPRFKVFCRLIEHTTFPQEDRRADIEHTAITMHEADDLDLRRQGCDLMIELCQKIERFLTESMAKNTEHSDDVDLMNEYHKMVQGTIDDHFESISTAADHAQLLRIWTPNSRSGVDEEEYLSMVAEFFERHPDFSLPDSTAIISRKAAYAASTRRNNTVRKQYMDRLTAAAPRSNVYNFTHDSKQALFEGKFMDLCEQMQRQQFSFGTVDFTGSVAVSEVKIHQKVLSYLLHAKAVQEVNDNMISVQQANDLTFFERTTSDLLELSSHTMHDIAAACVSRIFPSSANVSDQWLIWFRRLEAWLRRSGPAPHGIPCELLLWLIIRYRCMNIITIGVNLSASEQGQHRVHCLAHQQESLRILQSVSSEVAPPAAILDAEINIIESTILVAGSLHAKSNELITKDQLDQCIQYACDLRGRIIGLEPAKEWQLLRQFVQLNFLRINLYDIGREVTMFKYARSASDEYERYCRVYNNQMVSELMFGGTYKATKDQFGIVCNDAVALAVVTLRACPQFTQRPHGVGLDTDASQIGDELFLECVKELSFWIQRSKARSLAEILSTLTGSINLSHALRATPLLPEEIRETLLTSGNNTLLLDFASASFGWQHNDGAFAVYRNGDMLGVERVSSASYERQDWTQHWLDSQTPLASVIDAQMALRFWSHIISSLEHYVQPDDLIIFSPVQHLSRAPLHAVKLGSVPLIQRHPVIFAQSLPVLRLCQSMQDQEHQHEVRNTLHQAVLINTIEDPSVLSAKSLFKLSQILRTSVISSSHCSKDMLRRVLAKRNIIHIYGHAVYDQGNPTEQYVALSESSSDPETRLSMSEIFDMRLIPGSLVVIMGCNSGRAETTSQDDHTGLVSAFHCAGASTVISTLWMVDRYDSLKFAEVFYEEVVRELTNGAGDFINIAIPFQKAVCALRRSDDGTMRSPYHWAGFTLNGSWLLRKVPLKSTIPSLPVVDEGTSDEEVENVDTGTDQGDCIPS